MNPFPLASGFSLKEQSAKETGRAFAGGAAAADDASIIFYNPAGMTKLERSQVSLNSHFLFVDGAQQNDGTTLTVPGRPTAIPVTGNNGGNPFDQPVIVPTGYAAFPCEIVKPPRPWAEKVFNIQRWSVMPSGGHFAAMEEPEALAREIREFFRPLRGAAR